MKMNSLTGILVFLGIVNIAAVDTYLAYRLFAAPEEGVTSPGSARAVAGTRSGVRVSRLDSVQRKELSRIKKAFRDSTDEIQLRLQALDDEIYDLLRQDPVPETVIDSLLGEIGTLRLEKSRIAVRTMVETRSYLTREQQLELFRAIFRTRPATAGAAGIVDPSRAPSRRGVSP